MLSFQIQTSVKPKWQVFQKVISHLSVKRITTKSVSSTSHLCLHCRQLHRNLFHGHLHYKSPFQAADWSDVVKLLLHCSELICYVKFSSLCSCLWERFYCIQIYCWRVPRYNLMLVVKWSGTWVYNTMYTFVNCMYAMLTM